MKKLLITTFLVIFFILPFNFVFSQNNPNRVDCDVCGYCPSINPTPPSNWRSCAKCLYPSIYPATPVPDGKTLAIDPQTNEPIKPQKGRFYSFLGCIRTDFGSFQEPGSAASIVKVLSRFIFGVVGILSFAYLVYGSFVLTTAQGSPEKINRGRFIIKRAIIGLIFTLLSFFILGIILGRVLGLPWFK